jgi:lysophospholipase L1-like esterase
MLLIFLGVGIIIFILVLIRALGYRRDFQLCEQKYQILKQDWEGRQIYRKHNHLLPVNPQVILIGASEIERWNLQKFFQRNDLLNRGIGEQISAQLLLRFYQDVLQLAPQIVVISTGANDIRNQVPLEVFQEYIQRMCEAALRQNIHVILATITPVNDTQPDMLKLRPPEKIKAWNNWLRDYARKKGYRLADFYQVLTDQNGLLPKRLSPDGVHLNDEGYVIISRVLNEALSEMIPHRLH